MQHSSVETVPMQFNFILLYLDRYMWSIITTKRSWLSVSATTRFRCSCLQCYGHVIPYRFFWRGDRCSVCFFVKCLRFLYLYEHLLQTPPPQVAYGRQNSLVPHSFHKELPHGTKRLLCIKWSQLF